MKTCIKINKMRQHICLAKTIRSLLPRHASRYIGAVELLWYLKIAESLLPLPHIWALLCIWYKWTTLCKAIFADCHLMKLVKHYCKVSGLQNTLSIKLLTLNSVDASSDLSSSQMQNAFSNKTQTYFISL